MKEDRILKRIQKYVDFMTKFTVRIISFSGNQKVSGRRAGFLYQRKENEAPLIITAGHECPTAGSFVETRILKNNKPLCYNAGKFEIFHTEGQVDFAYR